MRPSPGLVALGLAAVAALSATGCTLTFDDPDPGEPRPDADGTWPSPDARPPRPDAPTPPDADTGVAGLIRAEGVVAPFVVELTSSAGAAQTVAIDHDGEFALPAPLPPGARYQARLLDAPRCVLACGAGASADGSVDGIVDGPVRIEVTCAGVTTLAALGLDGPGARPDPIELLDGAVDYHAEVGELQQVTRVTATPRSAAATLTVAGAPTAAGVASAALALAAPTTTLTVVVDHPAHAALRTTYTVQVDRTAATAARSHHKQFAQATDFLGWSLATDGARTIVGAAREGSVDDPAGASNPAPSSGAAYVYRNVGTTLEYEGFLKAPNPQGTVGAEDGDVFGWAVAIAGDVAVVAAPFEDGGLADDLGDESVTDAGAVYVFRRVDGATGPSWEFAQYLKSPAPSPRGYFGWAVATDGEVIAVGAYNESARDGAGAVRAPLSGQIHVFRRGGAGWALEASLARPGPGAAYDRLGHGLAMRGDLILGGAIAGHPDGSGAGAVLTFARTSAGWTHQADLVPPGPADSYAGNFFGADLAFDGHTLVVGMAEPVTGGSQVSTAPGAAFVYQRAGAGWVADGVLRAPNPDADDEFGYHVRVAGDVIAVTALREDGAGVGVCGPDQADGAGDTGAVYLFQRGAAGWAPTRYLKPSPAAPGAGFGTGLAVLPSGLVLVGAAGEDAEAVNSGALYLYW